MRRYKSYVASMIERFTGNKLTKNEWGHLSKIVSVYSEESIDEALDLLYQLVLVDKPVSLKILHTILTTDTGRHKNLSREDLINHFADLEQQGKEMLGNLLNARNTL